MNPEDGIKAKNLNQLYYIIEFMISHVKSKEKAYKEKLSEIKEENKSLRQIVEDKDLTSFKDKSISAVSRNENILGND